MRVFVTGASGWIGRGLVPELAAAGHTVTGLARSDPAAQALRAAGAEVRPGSLDDLGTLRATAASSDGVIHLAFKHDIAFTGDYAGATDADRAAIDTLGEALAGTGKPFVVASGIRPIGPSRRRPLAAAWFRTRG
jgi:nucleoside-diphosphate-sugar epimerase